MARTAKETDDEAADDAVVTEETNTDETKAPKAGKVVDGWPGREPEPAAEAESK